MLLEDLNLAHNALATLPDSLGAWRARASPRHGRAEAPFPTPSGKLVRLRSLGLRSNALTALPASLGALCRLESLYLTDNALTALPDTVGGWRSLRKLQAATNRLTALPDALMELPYLVRLERW